MDFFRNHKLVEGDYRLDELAIQQTIGSGNSCVYAAKIRDRAVAVKEVIIKNDEEVKMVHREIKLMKELSEENSDIIRYEGSLFTVEQVGPYNKTRFAYIVMEQGLASLESLVQRRITQRQPFRQEEIEAILGTLVRVFLFLERRGVAHCDIKPENIILMSIEPMIVKICDIGSCRIITNEATEWATLVGTVPFLAPQLIRNYMSSTHCNNPFKSDVYSLGLCLLYLVTFKKFKSSERLKVDERIYQEIVGEWVREAKEKRCYDRLIWQLLDHTLEFDESKRVQFAQLQKLMEEVLELRQQERTQQYKFAEKKMEEAGARLRLFEQQFSSVQESFLERPLRERSKEPEAHREKSTTNTNGFRSTRPKITKAESHRTDKVTSKDIREDPTRCRLPRIPLPLQTTTAPFMKKISVTNANTMVTMTEAESPTRSKKSNPSFQSNTLIIVGRNQFATLEQTLPPLQDRYVVLNNWYWNFETVQALSVNVRSDYRLAAVLSNLNKLYSLRSLVLNLDDYRGDPLLIEPTDNFMEVSSLCISARRIELEPYHQLFSFLLTDSVKKVTLMLSDSTVRPERLLQLLSFVSNGACEKLTLYLDNVQFEGSHNRHLMELLAKSKLKKLAVHLSQNCISYDKEFPWQLPKTLYSLKLNYSDNRVGVALSSLSLHLHLIKSELRELHLNLKHCAISNKELNCLFSCLCKMELDTVILRLSENEFDDAAIKFMSKGMQNLTNLAVLEFELQGTQVTQQGWALLVQSVDKLFKQRLVHTKISYNRFDRKDALANRVKALLRSDAPIKMDLLCVNNDFFSLYLRKKPIAIKPTNTRNFCGRLFSNIPTSNHYMCLGCASQKEMRKYKYLCQFCVAQCAHRNHNLVRLYSAELCSCPFSGDCKSDVNEIPCSRQYGELYQKKYECLKCSLQDCCGGCIGACKRDHEPFVRECKDPGEFECRQVEQSL